MMAFALGMFGGFFTAALIGGPVLSPFRACAFPAPGQWLGRSNSVQQIPPIRLYR